MYKKDDISEMFLPSHNEVEKRTHTANGEGDDEVRLGEGAGADIDEGEEQGGAGESEEAERSRVGELSCSHTYSWFASVSQAPFPHLI